MIDLTLHMTGNRLLALARKPAPVQATYLGYPSTTGLTAIDYRISDAHFDPEPNVGPKVYAEETINSPGGFWCYSLLGTETTVNDLPALTQKHITFGCLNNFCKVNDTVIQTWAQILAKIPNSRIIILCPEGPARSHTLALFQQNGIESARIEFTALLTSRDYFRLYHHIDIALDTFPCNGHTTSMDGCWMGVPVVTMVGPTNMGRGGLNLLSNLNLPELIAHTPDQFIQIATDLAHDTDRLRTLRRTLRQRMQTSPLMNPQRFIEGLESVYRTMWKRHAKQNP
jgi:predicted O-linked N-acetylglucosamine transferase (SPINDLY family)